MTESITHHRLTRLALSKCLLGQPDLISIKQTKVSSNFFKQEKRIEDCQENYINGLIFPTTAHFSSFISTRYKAKDPSKLTVSARLYMFDAFGEKDVHIEVNIPGSMEVTSFNLKGEQVRFEKIDYQGAYFSSFLRSLRPMNYPNIILYPLLNRIELLKSIIKNFIPFSFKHHLRDLGFELDIYRRQREYSDDTQNLGIEILIQYCIENHFGNILDLILQELKKQSLPKYHQVDFKVKLMMKKYPEIICKTAEKLLLHGHAQQLKERQILALSPLGKHQEVAYIGKSLLESGCTNRQIATCILIALIETNQDVRFLKSLNLLNNLHNSSEKCLKDVSHNNNNNGVLQVEKQAQKGATISQCPDLCFPFDNHFYNRLQECKNHQILLRKNSKEGFTLSMLDSIQASLKENPPFYDMLVRYEKQKGWKTLMKYRTESFWLETDFQKAEEMLKANGNEDFSDSSSFFQQKFDEEEEVVQEHNKETKPQQTEQEDPVKQQKKEGVNNEADDENESFDGNLSEHQEQKESFYLPKCSTRIQSRPKERNRPANKILCGTRLEQLFELLYSDLKLQYSLDIWEMKLRETSREDFTQAKRELAAMIFLKKGLLHHKMQRGKKCEQALKMARKLSSSPALNLVAIYQLLLLYIQSKNTKGVEFYLIELLKLFKFLGIESFDIVPEWSKPIMQYILTHEGLSIIKNIHPVFKAVFAIFLRANYMQQEVEGIVQSKKDK